MSVRSLTQPNDTTLYAKKIITEEINGEETIFVPDPTSAPLQYVLKKVAEPDVINWSVDSGGVIPDPFILAGNDFIDKFQVKNNAGDNIYTVNTVDNTVTTQADLINLISDVTEITSSNISAVTGQNQALLQTLSASVFVNGSDVSIEGSDSKDKFIVKNGVGDSDFAISTQGGSVSCLIKGGDVTQKLNVEDSGGKSIILCDTVNKDLISVGSLKLADIATSVVYFETSNTNQTVNIKGDDNGSKLRVGRLNGNDMVRVDSVGNNVFIGGGSNTSAFIHDIDSAQFRVSSNTPPSLLLSAIGTFATFMEFSTGPSFNSIETDRRLDISSTDDLTLLANTSQLTLQTGNMLFIEDTTTPAKNHLEISYNSIVSKGNPLTNTANITFDTTTSTISQSDTTMDNISINNPPSLPEHGIRLDYLQAQLGYIAAGLTASVQATGGIAGDQSLDPVTFSGSPTVPANAFAVGNSFHLVCSGNCDYNNGDPVIVKILAGANVFADISFSAPNTGASFFEIEADFTVRAINAGIAEIAASVDFTYQDGGAFVGNRSLTITNTVDTTVQNTLMVVADLSGANAASTMQTQLYYLKKMH